MDSSVFPLCHYLLLWISTHPHSPSSRICTEGINGGKSSLCTSRVTWLHNTLRPCTKPALLFLKLWDSSPSTNDLSPFLCKLVTLPSRLSLPISLHPTHSLCMCSLTDKRVAGAPPWPLRERWSVTETVVPNQTQVEIGLWARINSELASTLVLWRAAQLWSDDPY